MPRLEVKGIYSQKFSSPEKTLKEMLRFDEGEIESVESENETFTAIVLVRKYTPDRWKSFGLKTKRV
jgi:hypothetical protein